MTVQIQSEYWHSKHLFKRLIFDNSRLEKISLTNCNQGSMSYWNHGHHTVLGMMEVITNLRSQHKLLFSTFIIAYRFMY